MLFLDYNYLTEIILFTFYLTGVNLSYILIL